MSHIPNCREDENYNEIFLNESDSQYIYGYDICVNENIDNFFNNLMDWEDDIREALFLDSEDEDADIPIDIDYEVIWDDDMYYSDYQEEDLGKMSSITRLFLLLKERMLEWAECNRNEIITGLIESMDDDEYEELKKKFKSGEYKNAITRSREYQKKYDAGEIPTCYEYKQDKSGKTIKIGHCPNGTDIIYPVETQ